MKAIAIALALVALVSAARPKWHSLDGYTFEQYRKDFDKS